MISFGKFLSHKPETTISAVKTLINGISQTAVGAGSWDREEFCHRLDVAAERLGPESDNQTLDAEVASVVEALARYNSAAEQRSAGQQHELRSIISASLDTVAGIGSSSETSIQQLSSLEAKLQSASAIEDLRVLRGKILGCLALVRNETARMQMDSQRLIRSLHASVLRASAELQPAIDPTTGLPGPEALERSLKRTSGTERHLAMFVITDMISINAQYGRAVGDDVLRLATEHLVHAFGNSGEVHRWYGPSFLVLAVGDLTLDQLKEKARALARTPFSASLAAHGEMKSIPVFVSWFVEILPEGQLTDAVREKLNAFSSKHVLESERLPS